MNASLKLRALAKEFIARYLRQNDAERQSAETELYQLLRRVQDASDYDDSDNFNEGTVFVVMPFSEPDSDGVYLALREECSRLGLEAVRSDDLPGAGPIIDEVFKAIERAEFVICDLTHERPNVYYELGYAHGIGNEPLDLFLIARKGTELHFDIAGKRVRYYESIAHLRNIMQVYFAATVKACRRNEGRT